MIRLAFAALAVLTLTGGAAAEEVDAPTLVDLFVKTCALRPALPSELDRIASEVGFASEHGPVSPEWESGPKIDIVYFAKLMVRGQKVGLSAYFTGPVDRPTVSCSVHSLSASTDGLADLIEQSLKTHDRTDKVTANGDRREVDWHMGAAGTGDTLELHTYQDPPRRASISTTYLGHKR